MPPSAGGEADRRMCGIARCETRDRSSGSFALTASLHALTRELHLSLDVAAYDQVVWPCPARGHRAAPSCDDIVMTSCANGSRCSNRSHAWLAGQTSVGSQGPRECLGQNRNDKAFVSIPSNILHDNDCPPETLMRLAHVRGTSSFFLDFSLQFLLQSFFWFSIWFSFSFSLLRITLSRHSL